VKIAEKPRFEIDTERRQVRWNTKEVKLGSRAFDVLRVLHAGRGKLVPKDELIEQVWRDVVVEENNLHVHISAIRRVFGRNALVTVPGRGYQWTLPEDEPSAISQTPTTYVNASTASLDPRTPQRLQARLIGRDRDIERVTVMLNESRWVVIQGAGGIGKTSLARVVAAARSHEPVLWVDLSAIERGEQIVATIAKVAGIAIADDREAENELLSALAARTGLVVLDNCEHVKRGVERWIAALLDTASVTRVLATSQEPFHSVDARTYRLDTLALPENDASNAAIRSSASVELLEQRARADNQRFQITEAELPLAADLCRQLDGMPLAIEMAAVRLSTLGLRGLNERLGDRIRIFRSRFPDAPMRQQSLRGALDWSYSLLSAQEQKLLLYLSEFLGGFRLDAVQIVGSQFGLDEFETLDLLDTLIDKSSVRVDTVNPLRYRIAETARLYAQERLQSEGLKNDASLAHANAMTEVAAKQRRALTEINDDGWLNENFPDYENLERALAYGVRVCDPEAIAATAQLLISIDDVRSIVSPNTRERIRIAYEAFAYATGSTRARLASCVATTPHIADPILPRKEAARLAVEAWKSEDDAEQLGYAWARYAYNCASTKDFDAARDALQNYERINRSSFSPRTRLRVARLLAAVASYLGDAATMISHLQRALELTEAAGAKRRTAILLMEIGDAMLVAERYEEAVQFGERGITMLIELGLHRPLRYAYANTIGAQCFVGNLDRAYELARAALLPNIVANKFDIQGDSFSLLLALRGQHEAAATLMGASDGWYGMAGYARETSDQRTMQRARALCESAIGSERFEALRSSGMKLSADEAIALANASLRVAA
jgi:predicted ATPase/DNA-binding winged helix-turn-helix (wHTH) protein